MPTALLLFVSLFFLFAPQPVLAQANPLDNPDIQNLLKGKELTNQNYNAAKNGNFSLLNVLNGAMCVAADQSPIDSCVAYTLSADGKTVKPMAYAKVPGGGVAGTVGRYIASLYNPPTSSTEYLADIGEHLGVVKTAHAQVTGSGAGVIDPVKALWQFVQKVAYIAYILVFIAVGFMVMFRRKMNPQTIVSVQAALPGLVIGLVLITFSYFISALIIDIGFVSVQVVGHIFAQEGLKNIFGSDQQIQVLARDSNILQLYGGVANVGNNFTDVTGGVYRSLSSVFNFGGAGGVFALIIPAVTGALIGFLATGLNPLGGAAGFAAGFSVPIVLGLIVPLVLILALIIQFFRLFFLLIGAYIALLVSTVTAPIVILWSSIPGQGGKLSLWWKTLLANALIFPAVFSAFLFAGMILATNPEQWKAAPPLFGGLDTELLKLIVAYGIILGTPAIPQLVKNMLGVKDIQGIQQQAIGAFTGGFNLGRTGLQKGWDKSTSGIKAQRDARKKFISEYESGVLSQTQYGQQYADIMAQGGRALRAPIPAGVTPSAGIRPYTWRDALRPRNWKDMFIRSAKP